MRRFILVAPLVLAVLGSAPALAQQILGPVTVQARLDKTTYLPGEPVVAHLEVRNVSAGAATLYFPSSQRSDLMIRRQGEEIWRWSQGKMFLTVVQTVEIPAGGTLEYSVTWGQRAADGTVAPPGDYVAEAVFLGAPRLGGPRTVVGPLPFSVGPPTARVSAQAAVIGGREVGDVLIAGRVVLRIRTPAGGFSAPQRAEVVAGRLQFLIERGLRPEEMQVTVVGAEVAVVARGRLIVTADRLHARMNATTPSALAVLWKDQIAHALSFAR